MLKKEWRRRLRAQYALVTPCDLSEEVRALPVYRQAQTVALYMANSFEVSIAGLLEDADKTVLLPRCEESGMAFCRYDGTLAPDRFGILAPATAPWQDRIDLMIVPALAFDKGGGRLGRGGGFYDRALADYEGVSVGVIRDAFLFDEVPMEEHDCRVGHIVTEKGVYTVL